MQKAGVVFKEYIWLVKTIHTAKRITLKELNDKWRETEMSGGLELARTTFNRHKDAIEQIFAYTLNATGKIISDTLSVMTTFSMKTLFRTGCCQPYR